jgi:hypothetical protein
MAAIDRRFDSLDAQMAEMRADISRLQDRLVQIGFGLAGMQFAGFVVTVMTTLLAR